MVKDLLQYSVAKYKGSKILEPIMLRVRGVSSSGGS